MMRFFTLSLIIITAVTMAEDFEPNYADPAGLALTVPIFSFSFGLSTSIPTYT
jgi:amino acid permease